GLADVVPGVGVAGHALVRGAAAAAARGGRADVAPARGGPVRARPGGPGAAVGAGARVPVPVHDARGAAALGRLVGARGARDARRPGGPGAPASSAGPARVSAEHGVAVVIGRFPAATSCSTASGVVLGARRRAQPFGTGWAGSGESEVRGWLLEARGVARADAHDLGDAVGHVDDGRGLAAALAAVDDGVADVVEQ